MSMNRVIQEKRRELGLTQEAVAAYLHVSTPAVSKWESGSTCPDVSLLAPLARLLKTDLNTLMCFQEALTAEEIGAFCRELAKIQEESGIAAAFSEAEEKLYSYPNSEMLLQCVTMQLDALLELQGLEAEERRQFDDRIEAWYRTLAQSPDAKIGNSAKFMMASRYIRMGNHTKAQEMLDEMPDRSELTSTMGDKLMLQVIVYQRQGKAEQAVEELQRALLSCLNRLQLLLCKLIDAEQACGEMRTAEKIAEKTKKMAEVFDLWPCIGHTALLTVALAEQDPQKSIELLKNALEAMLTPWDGRDSPLFYRLKLSGGGLNPQLQRAVLTQMESAPEYAFLRTRQDYQTLLRAYKARIAP